jgi:hypothetical protein
MFLIEAFSFEISEDSPTSEERASSRAAKSGAAAMPASAAATSGSTTPELIGFEPDIGSSLPLLGGF